MMAVGLSFVFVIFLEPTQRPPEGKGGNEQATDANCSTAKDHLTDTTYERQDHDHSNTPRKQGSPEGFNRLVGRVQLFDDRLPTEREGTGFEKESLEIFHRFGRGKESDKDGY